MTGLLALGVAASALAAWAIVRLLGPHVPPHDDPGLTDAERRHLDAHWPEVFDAYHEFPKDD
ncbi:hypothetical protein ACEZCY_14500 [Streptacidiphilus sp. N1-12]|uniref:Uncharacterized protein n=2 Tax=Streptacidiphilus alkalitolerans TaxID=3342712 RepID=A0ABV6WEL4_9ACTN